MKISKNELRRIAQICLLNFSDDEYDSLKESLERTIEQAQLLYQSDDFDTVYAQNEAFLNDYFMETNKKNFSFCKNKKIT